MPSFPSELIVVGVLAIGWVLGKFSHTNKGDFEKPYEDMKQLVHALSDMNVQLINQLRSGIPSSYTAGPQYPTETTSDPLEKLQQEIDYAMSGGQ